MECLVLVFFLVKISKIFLFSLGKNWMFYQLWTCRSFLRIDLYHNLEHGVDIWGEVLWHLGEYSFQDLFVKSLHVLCLKWRLQGNHFVDNTAQTPYVTLDVVRFILPNFWWGVIRSSGLSVVEALLVCDLTDIHISQFGLHVVVQEDISTLQVPVHDLNFVHWVESSHNLNKDLPNLSFFDVGFVLFMVTDLLKDVSVVCQFHNNAKTHLIKKWWWLTTSFCSSRQWMLPCTEWHWDVWLKQEFWPHWWHFLFLFHWGGQAWPS